VRPAGLTYLTVIIMKIDKSLLLTRQAEELAKSQLQHREVFMERKPLAKYWPDEQESHTRQLRRMRRHRTLEFQTCTAGVDLYTAGISVKDKCEGNCEKPSHK